MLKGVHLLLTYMCNFECDHCFVYSGPEAKGTFTLNQLNSIFEELGKIGTIQWVYFEGGEPFLFYPLMVEGIRIARAKGFKTGVVTNAYWATSEEDAQLWLRPLAELQVSDFSISDDSFHYEEEDRPTKHALTGAKQLGIPSDVICIESPTIEISSSQNQSKGEPVTGGSAMFRGRAVDKLIEGLPRRRWSDFTECPYEDLKNPSRVHLDAFGNVQLCQGLCMGNMWETPLSKLVQSYSWDSHPISRPLVEGGPALLAKQYDVKHEEEAVDACHLCYSVRLALLDKFPQYLAPRQVYGLANG